MITYEQFLERKAQMGAAHGFTPIVMPKFLFPFQRALTTWNIEKGRGAIFADCGLGKTLMELVWGQNVLEKTGKPVLLLTPLAVGPQTVREAKKFGLDAKQSRDGKIAGPITVTNYEQLHKYDPADFGGVACDESSILKHFTGQTQKQVTRFMIKIPYRSLWTATAAPNDYTELGTSSEALGELGYTDMLTRFFKQEDAKACRKNDVNAWNKAKKGNHFAKLAYRVSQQMSGWRLKGHAQEPFWRWVCSWARACRKPSDIGFDDTGFNLPELIEREHIIMPTTPPEGEMFTLPAFGLKEEREERKRTTKERCELAAELVNHNRPAVVWCHLNPEGELLEKMIPNSLEVAGRHDDEYKERVAEWFIGERCICNDPMFKHKLATWRNQKDQRAIGSNGIDSTAKKDLLKLSNMPSGTKKNVEPISQSTTGQTKLNTDSPKSRRKQRTTNAEGDMGPILNTENGINSKSNSGKRPIQKSGLISECENTESPETTTGGCLQSKTESARFAEPTGQIKEAADSMLTIAMKAVASEGSCVLTVTKDLVNSAIAQCCSEAQHCICGHENGNRKLITKSKIFGFGLNWQHCAHVVTFASHSYEQYYQSIRRCWRFGQQSPVTVDIIASEGERYVRENMVRKGKAAEAMFSKLVQHMNDSLTLKNEIGNQTIELPKWI